ncbi:MAG TPA: hypothetical protein VFU81_08965, partial [Thermomicrobiales bacterium]|nr:hypothetical protein [Thermomicrobiales bacterium]
RRAGRDAAQTAPDRAPTPLPILPAAPAPRLAAVPAAANSDAEAAADTPEARPRVRPSGSRPRAGGGSNVGRRAASNPDAA